METINLINDFMHIAEVMVEKSNGKLRIACQEKSTTRGKDDEVGHFLKLNEERICRDIEDYGIQSVKDKLGHGIHDFLVVLPKVRADCPESYHEGLIALKKIGDKIFKGRILENWDRYFEPGSYFV